MKVQKLDHVALYMKDRDAAADFLTSHLGFHVVDHTERYTLVGAGGRIGKLTLFDAPGGAAPAPAMIERINIRVRDPEAAALGLPVEANAETQNGAYFFRGPEGLPLALVPGKGDFTDYDLEGLILGTKDPERAARDFAKMGFGSVENAGTLTAGEYRIHLVRSGHRENGRGMLYHLGCLVDSAQEHREQAEQKGFEVQDWVEGPNTLAVFVRGPEDMSVEYVEHKPTFSLT